ncbi:hypothetical protein AQJ23_42730 [Streptomyces antibioticus]|nr:hypothetical protein [Streptomyces antibioticus]KUN16885.1 hypothetical protein AQJ23_42730 [Streptomyces antibioticus]
MSRRYVFLDADGSGTEHGWAFVVVAAPTGVVHRTRAAASAASRTSRRAVSSPSSDGISTAT